VGYRKLSFAVRRRRIAIHEFDLFAPPRWTGFVLAGGNAFQPSQNFDLLTGARCCEKLGDEALQDRPIGLDCFARLPTAPLGITQHFTTRGLQRFELKHTDVATVA
jgi:hypothetical protein